VLGCFLFSTASRLALSPIQCVSFVERPEFSARAVPFLTNSFSWQDVQFSTRITLPLTLQWSIIYYCLLLSLSIDEAQDRSLSNPRDFCNGESGTKMYLSSSTLVVFCQYYSFSSPYYFSHLPPTLYNISNRQRREITHLKKKKQFWSRRKCDVVGSTVQYAPIKCQYENKNVIFIAEFFFFFFLFFSSSSS